jgi:hypothetical protein
MSLSDVVADRTPALVVATALCLLLIGVVVGGVVDVLTFVDYVVDYRTTLMCSRLLISESRFDSVFECFSTGFSEEFAA